MDPGRDWIGELPCREHNTCEDPDGEEPGLCKQPRTAHVAGSQQVRGQGTSDNTDFMRHPGSKKHLNFFFPNRTQYEIWGKNEAEKHQKYYILTFNFTKHRSVLTLRITDNKTTAN